MLPRLLHSNGRLVKRCWQLPRRRSYSSVAQDAARALSAGDKLHGYTVQKVEEVPELFLTAVSLQHDTTGTKHLHVAREDINNTFSVAFRTTPMDSTGVPHILEHTVLCGSRKYPVRDPFFKMLNRSLATFMNALTASDWTMYPFSTQNKKDFYNLMSIYMDATFYPQLRELDFSQEGWRLEHDNLQDQSSPLNFKGVVYNEMKGVFSTSQNVYAEAVQNHLLPNHTYGVCSGGDPASIPDLTWQHLKDFHKTHYHPSNARFYTYGMFPLEDHLSFINNNYLRHFQSIDSNTEVPPEPRWSFPRESSISCQPDTMAPDPSKQTTVSVSFLLSDITDLEESTTLSIISALLTAGEKAPFYEALLDANIGSDYSPVVGYNGYTKEGSFTVGLQGIHKDDVEKVKQIISDTIDKVIREGFEQSRIDALLHRIELDMKHQKSNFGLGLVMSITSGWNHDGDASEMLMVNKQVALLKQKMASNPQYLQDKVKQYLKDNPHRLTLVMSPDAQYEEKRQQAEDAKLQSCIDRLTDQDREHVYKLGAELQTVQNSQEDLSCLPCINLSEIDASIKREEIQHTSFDGVSVQYCSQPTNEVTYIKMMSYLDQVPEEMKIYVPLFTNVITKMGAGIYDYKELSHQMELCSGGMGASTQVIPDPTDSLGYEEGVLLSSYCLDRNLDRMLALWTEIFDRSNLQDSSRLTTLIRMSAAELAAGVASMGHNYAMTHSAATLSPAGQLAELFSGVTQVSMMKKVAEAEDNSKLMEHLVELSQEILNKNNLKVCINATPEFMPTALGRVEEFVESLRSSRKPGQAVPEAHTLHLSRFEATSQKNHIVFPFSVNYMSKSIRTVPYTHQDFSTLRVLSRLLSWKYLHREIREKGGAYGGGASCSNGVMSFFSYRDPNSMATLDVFDQSIDWATRGEFTDNDIEEAKLSVFQQTDKPVPPGSVGSTLFLSGITDNMRQQARDRLFRVSKDDLVQATQRYLVTGQQPSSLSFIGPANEAVTQNNGWKILE